MVEYKLKQFIEEKINLQVKKSLTGENYKIFKNLVACYTKNESSFDHVLSTLEKLFLTDHKVKRLFIGNYFKTFFSKSLTYMIL